MAKVLDTNIDVDVIWEQMNAPGIGLQSAEPPPGGDQAGKTKHGPDNDTVMANGERDAGQGSAFRRANATNREEMVTIKRAYKFAGKLVAEEKVVPKDSAEAKLFFSSGNAVDAAGATANKATPPTPRIRRPLWRPSRFDPNPSGLVKKSWEKQECTITDGATGPKLNTVEKSKLDWAAYVDKAGLKDDLDLHSKAKEGYLGRMDFLDRTEARKEEERRNARLKK
jgi:hypothetical protein